MVFDVNGLGFNLDIQSKQFFNAPEMPLLYSGVDIITIGQYLQPSKKHLPVKSFIHPDQFEKYKLIAKDLGFLHVESGPLVRSSYKAHKHIE